MIILSQCSSGLIPSVCHFKVIDEAFGALGCGGGGGFGGGCRGAATAPSCRGLAATYSIQNLILIVK